MSEFTWGDMPKSQIDPQLITEYVSQAIADHESDPQAHLGDGESLQQHKSNEMLDHPALSIVPDKLNSSNNFFDLGVNGDITGQGDNYTALFAGFLASMEQDSPLTGDATFNLFSYETSDFLYNDGDIVHDFIFGGSGSTGTWTASFKNGFADVQIKQGNVRYGYYDGSWHYSSWTAIDPLVKQKFRIHYDSINERLIIYINGVSVYDISYTINIEDDQFNLIITLNRGTSTFSGVFFGAIRFGFDSTS